MRPGTSPEARIRRRRHLPVLAVCAAAWAAVLVGTPMADEAEQHHHAVAPGQGALTAAGPWLVGWVVMLTAMMAPTLLELVRHVHARTRPRLRGVVLGLVLLAYASVWTVAGLALTAAATSLRGLGLPAGATLALAGGIAVGWQATPAKQRCLNRLHAHPAMAAFGARACVDGLRLGTRHGGWCVGSCWALMLLPLVLTTGHVAAMVVVSLWVWAEHLDRPVRPAWRLHTPQRAARLVARVGAPPTRPPVGAGAVGAATGRP
jgi:predicted metal-binding membrane protein